MQTLNRREFLVGCGTVAASGVLAACSTGTASRTSPPTAAPRIALGAVSVSAANSAIWAAEDGGYLNCGLSGMAVVASDLLPNGFYDDSFLKKLDDSGFIKSILGS